MRGLRSAGLACVLLALPLRALAEEPPHFTYAPAPPGTLIASQVVYLAGEAMHSQWRAVLSRLHAQWYLSIYAIDDTTYRLKYRSPSGDVPFPPGGPTVTSASIAAIGEFMGAGVQQVAIASHDTAGGRCGTGRIDVLFFDAAMEMPLSTLSVRTPCSLSARVVHEAHGDALAVTGPSSKTAIFRFTSGPGTWTQTPRLFQVVPSP
ncbi:MAG TPA: hypothetical protein VMD91_03740 [Candidatus Sulfotelmatobacter sp.]|nr:hypothetical protein [Candidatus Sulfotelmatobacter sp.]